MKSNLDTQKTPRGMKKQITIYMKLIKKTEKSEKWNVRTKKITNVSLYSKWFLRKCQFGISESINLCSFQFCKRKKFLTNSLSKSIYSRHLLMEMHYWSSGERALILPVSTMKLNCSGRRLMCFQKRRMSPNILRISLIRVRDYTNNYELSKKPKNLFHVLKAKFFSTIYFFCHILNKMKSVIYL